MLWNKTIGAGGQGGEPVGAWDISTFTYSGVAFDVTSQTTSFESIFFKPDGLKMYLVSRSGDIVYEYNLGTAWDITTLSYLQLLDVTAQDGNPQGIFLKPDGLKLYLTGDDNNSIYEYTLSTAWDVTTATYVQSLDVTAQDSRPQGLFFRSDGLKMYITGRTNDAIYEYTLSAAWDVTTATYVGSFTDGFSDTPYSVFFKPDGTVIYILLDGASAMLQYTLSTAWDISTATSDSSMSIFDFGNVVGLFFNPDGLSLYIANEDAGDIQLYASV